MSWKSPDFPINLTARFAMRGKWKLLALGGEPIELFDIEADENEKQNVLADHPELVASKAAEINEWLNAPRTTKRIGQRGLHDTR